MFEEDRRCIENYNNNNDNHRHSRGRLYLCDDVRICVSLPSACSTTTVPIRTTNRFRACQQDKSTIWT